MKMYSTGAIALGMFLAMGLDPIALLNGKLEPVSLSCASTQPVHRNETTQVHHMGVDLGIRVTEDNGKFTARNVSGQKITGCLRFKDADGNYIGDPTPVSLEDGEELCGSTPPNAKDFEVSDDPCPETKTQQVEQQSGGFFFGPDDGEDGPAPVLPVVAVPRKTQYTYWVSPVNIDPLADSKAFGVRVFTSKRNDALAVKDHIQQYGFSQPLPNYASVSHVEVFYYVEISPNIGTMSLDFTFADDDSFTAIDIDVNGLSSVLDISQAQGVVTFNGWEALRLTLPMRHSSLNYDPTAGAQWTNLIDARISTDERNELAPTLFSNDITFQSE